MLQTQKIEYRDGDVLLEGYYAFDDAITGKRPVVLVAHDWSGRNPFSEKKSEKLAALGYVGFALDMFGKGVHGKTKDEKMALISPFMQDRRRVAQRMLSAFNTARELEQSDPHQVGAIGFCFGGLCVLDLARSGVDVRGVVSFHGLLGTLPHPVSHPIRAKVLVLHGHDDPMAPPTQVAEFQKEMTAAKADWQTLVYGNTLHAFTNPDANDLGFGTVYDARADRRSWTAMKSFFKEDVFT